MADFKDPVARDRAWARWYSKNGARPLIERCPALFRPKGWQPLSLKLEERLEIWRRKARLLTVEQMNHPVVRKFPSCHFPKEQSHEQFEERDSSDR